jgi:hypothetical protein
LGLVSFQDAKDNPKRLVVILDLLKGTDKRLKVMGVEAKRMRELFDALWDARHIFSDEDLGDLVSCFYHSATMRDSLAAAHSRFRDTKWAVEEDLRGQRNELQSNLLDIMQKQISEVLTWDVKHKHAHYLSNLKDLASLLDERSEEGVAIIRQETPAHSGRQSGRQSLHCPCRCTSGLIWPPCGGCYECKDCGFVEAA